MRKIDRENSKLNNDMKNNTKLDKDLEPLPNYLIFSNADTLEFAEITNDIRKHPEFLKIKELKHHKRDIYHHTLRVSYLSYIWAKRLHLDYVSATRGGLLHDFFTYDWRYEGRLKKKKLFEKHGFTHPKEALKNSHNHFEINKIESDIIVKHMFPLTPSPPKYPEGWIVTCVDKYVTIAEYIEDLLH